MERALQRNIQTLYCMTFFQSAMVVSAVFVPLLQRHGLSMAEVLQTQAVFALVVAALEVPSGYLADLWGRKRAILLGQGFIVSAYGWFLFADGFADFVIYEVIIGVGISLCSGSDLALLYDTRSALQEQGARPQAVGANPISRLVAIESYGGAIAAVAASVLTLWSLEWVLLAQFGVAILAFAFACGLREVDRQLNVESHRDNVGRVFATIARQPLVLWTSAAIVICGVGSLLGFWLVQKYWEAQQVPLHLFGYIWALHGIIRGLSAHAANAVEEALGWRGVFVLVALLPVLGFCGMGLLGGWPGILCGLLLPLSRGLHMVVFYEALNRRVSATFRATVNSIVSLGTRSLFIVAGPLLGLLVDLHGVSVSFLTLSLVLLPCCCLVLLVLSRLITSASAAARPAL